MFGFADLNSRVIPTRKCGGEGGIRTPGRDKPTTVFKTAALNRSATSPLLY